MSITEKEKQLRKELSETRELLSKAVDMLDEERKTQALAKNRVIGGYYMMSRRAEKNLRALQQSNPAAALIFSVIRENMQIGSNAVTVSNNALCKIINRITLGQAAHAMLAISYFFIFIATIDNNNAIQLSIG